MKDMSNESTVSDKEKIDVELGIHFKFHFKTSMGLTNSDMDRMDLGKAHIQEIFDADEPTEVSDPERTLYKIEQLELKGEYHLLSLSAMSYPPRRPFGRGCYHGGGEFHGSGTYRGGARPESVPCSEQVQPVE